MTLRVSHRAERHGDDPQSLYLRINRHGAGIGLF
jgi:hypothetical protein